MSRAEKPVSFSHKDIDLATQNPLKSSCLPGEDETRPSKTSELVLVSVTGMVPSIAPQYDIIKNKTLQLPAPSKGNKRLSQSHKIDFHLVCPGVATIPGQFGHCAENDGVLLGLVHVVGRHYQLMNDSSALTSSCMKEQIFASSTQSSQCFPEMCQSYSLHPLSSTVWLPEEMRGYDTD